MKPSLMNQWFLHLLPLIFLFYTSRGSCILIKQNTTVVISALSVNSHIFYLSSLQDVRAHLLPPPGEGSSGDGLRPRHADQRREDRGDCDRLGEPLSVQIRSPVWSAPVLLCVSWHMGHIHKNYICLYTTTCQDLHQSKRVCATHTCVLDRVWTSGGTSWHPGSCCTECVSGETSQSPSIRKMQCTSEGSSTQQLTLVSDTRSQILTWILIFFKNRFL